MSDLKEIIFDSDQSLHLPPEPSISAKDIEKAKIKAKGSLWHKLKLKVKKLFGRVEKPPTISYSDMGIRHNLNAGIRDTSQMTLLHDYGIGRNNKFDFRAYAAKRTEEIKRMTDEELSALEK